MKLVQKMLASLLLLILLTGCIQPNKETQNIQQSKEIQKTQTTYPQSKTKEKNLDKEKNLETKEIILQPKKVILQTSDNLSIYSTYYPSLNSNNKSIVLIHMLSKTKEDWKSFALSLQEKNYSVLAIDLRGHGQSTNLNQLNWQNFSSKEFNDMVKDVEAAVNYLKTQGFSENRISLIGASIGANIALNYSNQNPKINSIALLSPGLDYKGIKIDSSIKQFKGSLIIAASSEDAYSFNSSKTLFESSPAKTKEFKQFENKGHGTKMLLNTNLTKFLLSWLDNQ